MENLLLIGMSQQLAMRRQMDILANNIANMNTTAFKSESVLFEEHLVKTDSIERPARSLAFVRDVATIRNLTEGRSEPTGNPLDLAIVGKGFFTVGTVDGTRYTRNGHFMLDPEGRLVTGEGNPVLDADGNEITIQPGETALTISRDGSISTSAGLKGRLGLVSFANEADMKKIGTSLYDTAQSAEPTPTAEVIQGTLEQSNVEPIIEVTKMMQLLRNYQEVSQVMQRADELARQTIKEAGQIPQA